jgi:predicted TIM-barrel fold metal-dependent hydrolase
MDRRSLIILPRPWIVAVNTTPTRRVFLGTAALTVIGAAPREAVMVIDTHVHCFAGPADDRFPYHPAGPYRPGAAATPQDLLLAMDTAGVAAAVIVHPEPYQDDHRYLEYCLQQGAGRLKGTALFFADRDDTPARLRDLAKRCALAAVRVHAYAPDRLPPFGTPGLRTLWKLAGELGLAVQIHFEPRYAPGFEPYIEEFKDVRVLIDHLGRPFQGTPQEYERVVRWSRYPNTVMKLSSVPARETYPHRDPAPVVRQLTDAFGADRLMFGGGWHGGPAGTAYRAERERVRALLTHLSAGDQEKVFGGTAARVLGFK